MEEKVLIKSERYDIKKLLKVLLIVGVILSFLMIIGDIVDSISYYDDCLGEDYAETYYVHTESGIHWPFNNPSQCYECQLYEQGKFGYAVECFFEHGLYISIAPVATFALIGCLIYLWLRSYELTITDKRVYGHAAFGKRVDLPMDSVSAVATMGFKGIAVATSSGKIAFLMIKNRNEIHKTISELLIERQSKPDVTPTVSTPVATNADELKKYKELLDMGAISQEEFDAKKKQLLDL